MALTAATFVIGAPGLYEPVVWVSHANASWTPTGRVEEVSVLGVDIGDADNAWVPVPRLDIMGADVEAVTV